MSVTTSSLAALDEIELPVVDDRVIWEDIPNEHLHSIARGIFEELGAREPVEPTEGVLQRSIALEDTVRSASPLQHQYAGLIQDAFTNPTLRPTIDLPSGKTPFRDAKDVIAKTHGLRAYEANGRTRLAASLSPVRATDTERNDNTDVGETQYPLLGELHGQGKIHPSKFSTAVSLLESVDQAAEDAGRDQKFRSELQQVVERDLAEKIEHTTPEEFSKYASRRKHDLLASLDPKHHRFTDAQTERMHNLWSEGSVRGNPNAYKWSFITDAEGNEALKTLESAVNNPRTKKKTQDDESPEQDTFDETSVVEDDSSADDESTEHVQDTRTRGQRAMHALRDLIKFGLANFEHTKLPGSSGRHTKMVVLADYPTLIQHLRNQLAEHLPEINAQKRENLLKALAETEAGGPTAANGSSEPELPMQAQLEIDESSDAARPDSNLSDSTAINTQDRNVIELPPPKTTDLSEVLAEKNLDRLQPRIAQGIYTPYFPPDTLLRLLCDASVSPVTLTGEREILSIGRSTRAFPDHIRRAIMARDRGCIVPGCHWPAAWCELHHITFWSHDGHTSTDNGATICAHHHQALHHDMLSIERHNGQFKVVQHPLIDPQGEARQNLFWQN